MNGICRSGCRTMLLALALLVLALVGLAGCATPPDGSVRLAAIVRATPGGDPPWLRDDDAPGVRVRRAGGAEQPARSGLRLDAGDTVLTGPGVAAVLRIAGRGELAVDENSAVRIGSLELLFGRVFADLRGLFVVRSQTVEAVNEGTRYLFEVGRDRSVHVVVAEGVLSCRSLQGGWPALRLAAGQGLFSADPGREAPRILRADPRVVEGPLRAITDAPRAGWCCPVPGRPVFASTEDRCPGAFSVSRDAAQARCRPAPEPRVWCCAPRQQGPIETTPERCQALKGSPYASESAARQRCAFVK